MLRKKLYTHKQYSVEYDGGEPVIYARWTDFEGEKQWAVSELKPLTPNPALSPGAITIHSNMVKLSIGELQPKHLVNIRRGEVKPEFVGKKRKRMIDAVNSWRIPMNNVMFVTLSYPKEYPQDWKVWKNDLKIYKEHLQRKFPQSEGFWKLELQRRGAPHYHLVFDLNSEISLKDFRNWNDELWANIAHYLDTHAGVYACTVKKMSSPREALNYAAKYQTKETYAPVDAFGEIISSERLGDSIGRLWGRIGKPNCSPSETILVRREWALNNKAIFAQLIREMQQYSYADYLDRQGAHDSITLYGIGDSPEPNPYYNLPQPPPINDKIHAILKRHRAYQIYARPKYYRTT